MELLLNNIQSTLFWGFTFALLGKLLVSMTVIMVHSKITKEEHIDGIVLMEMHREKAVALTGVAFMIIGYLLELVGNGML